MFRIFLVAALAALLACSRQPASETVAPAATAHKATPAAPPAGNDADALAARMLQRRGVETIIWGLPAVNFERMYDALRKQGGELNQVLFWSRLPDWKNQTLTPNPDVIYVMPFYDTRNGPVVLEIPAANGGSITGTIDDAWQSAIEDVGPAGVDQGKGGKYLILPPGYKEPVPAGYFPARSSTFAGFALLRSNIGTGSDADVAKAADYARKIALYPLAQAANPPATKFVDVIGKEFVATIPYDHSFFEVLHRFVQREPWIERDRAMIDVLRTVGIERGKPFAPDPGKQAALNDAAKEAKAWLEARYLQVFSPYFPASRWAVPASPAVIEGMGSNFANTDAYPIDDRGLTYSLAFFSAKHLGQGQFYLMTINDKDGKPLDGGRTYRLRVPPNPPVSLYWSATAYDRDTHALIRDMERASRASTSQGMQKNEDGSVDVYFGPKAPAGHEGNWVPTRQGGNFEVLFRLYGPQQPLFEKTWSLPDIEEVSS